VNPRLPRLGKPDRDRLFRRARAVLAAPHVMDLLADVLSCLTGRRFFRHDFFPPSGESAILRPKENSMPRYVDGFVIPIQKKNVRAYKKIAQWGCRVWMKHGALSYYECVMDDFSEHGQGFRKLCKLKSGETAIFAYIVYRSKAHRNQVNKRVMKEFTGAPPKMPFSMNRFSMAGCKVIVRAT
jgi:uncharacterized protein YbaA (DUF1428 family)